MPTESVPTIDLADWQAGDPDPPHAVGAAIKAALQDVGFMVLVGHGVPAATIRGAFAACAAFHAQPAAAKRRVALDRNSNGYMAPRSTTIRTSTVAKNETPDLNEAFFFRTELAPDHPDVIAGRQYRGANQWPADLPGFRETALGYAAAMGGLAARLRRPLARALDLPADWFDPFFRAPQWVTRFSHYPPNDTAADVYGIAPHTDAGFFTLLPQTDVPGLEVRTMSGAWEPLAYTPGGIVFNSGDMLHRWSNGRLPSTPHRALPPVGGDRYAVPYFYGPDWDVEIAAAPSCVPAGETPRWPTTTYADYMAWWYGTNYGA